MNIKKILNLYINLNTESYKEDIKHYNMQNLIINFWNGKITLWKSYWIVGELINAFLILLILTVEIKYFNNALIANQIPFFVFNDFNLLSKLTLMMWTIFITIGIWRSAEEYQGGFIWIVLTLIFLSYKIFALRLIFFN